MSISKDSSQKFTAIAAVVIVALLGINAFLLYNKMQLDKANEKLTMEVDEGEKLKVELEKQYYEALSELESMRTNNEELNALIDSQKVALETSRGRIARLIRSGKTNKADLESAREQITLIRSQLDGYVTEVNTLKEEIGLLTETNQKLNEEKTALQTEIAEERTMNEELVSAKAALVSEKESLIGEKEELTKTVTKASTVKVNNVSGTAWKVKKSGKPKKTKYAKNTDRVKVCFTTTGNDLAATGTEKFHVRIINPLGETLAIEDMGSGVMTTAGAGDELRYTMVKELDYNNSEPGVGCFLWEPNVAFTPGKYTLEVFNKGYPAGQGDFLLK